jgi:DNA-binding MarR family transcriptional regulator
MKQTAAIWGMETGQAHGGSWLFLTNHMHVLASIARAPDATIRQTATRVGISERAAAQIIKDLEEGGYLTRTRLGRRNRYLLHRDLPLRHPMHGHRTVGELLDFLNDGL